MKSHIRNVHEIPKYTCGQCEYKSAQKTLLRHTLKLSMMVRCIIVINVNIVENKRVLLRHTLNLFIMGLGIIVINVNIKRHTRVLLRHILNQSIPLDNPCGKTLNSADSLRMHMTRVHDNPQQRSDLNLRHETLTSGSSVS